MKAYLASKYMSGAKADAILSRSTTGTKKKKRKQPAAGPSSSSSFVKDDDLSGFANLHDEEDDDTAAPVVASDRGFKKRRVAPDAAASASEESSWTTVREGEKPSADEDGSNSATTTAAPKPFTGGLLSRAQIAQALPSAASSKQTISEAEAAAAQETVYRDASGRKIDMAAAKADAAAKKREREEKEAKKLQWGKGLVQRDEAEETRKRLERMRTEGFARTKEDRELNEEQKAVERWNDPAAQFLSVSVSVSSRGCLGIQTASFVQKKKSKGPRRLRHQAWLPMGRCR
jgi:pre-mRNA-splicing factor CWC26